MQRLLDSDEERRARLLLEEGMPATWVAEDLGVASPSVYRVAVTIPDRTEHVREWQRTWAKLRRNPALLALHREFNPSDPNRLPRAA